MADHRAHSSRLKHGGPLSNSEKALSIYPGFLEGAVDMPQRMGEWSASQKNASWVWGGNTGSRQGLKDAEALR